MLSSLSPSPHIRANFMHNIIQAYNACADVVQQRLDDVLIYSKFCHLYAFECISVSAWACDRLDSLGRRGSRELWCTMVRRQLSPPASSRVNGSGAGGGKFEPAVHCRTLFLHMSVYIRRSATRYPHSASRRRPREEGTCCCWAVLRPEQPKASLCAPTLSFYSPRRSILTIRAPRDCRRRLRR